MARPGIEYKSVERVARQLLSQGQHPSIQRVRGILGTGSNTTIAKHLKSWQQAFSQSNSPILPKSVPEDLMVPLDDFWNTAVIRAEENYQKFKQELTISLSSAELNEANAISLLDKKSEEYDELQQHLSDVKLKLQETEQQLHNMQGKYSVLSSEIIFVHRELESTFELMKEQNLRLDNEPDKIYESHEESLRYERDCKAKSEEQLLDKIDHLRLKVKSNKVKERLEHNKLFKINEDKHQHELVMVQEIMDLSNKNKQLDIESQQYSQHMSQLKQQLESHQHNITKSITTIETLSQVNEHSINNEIVLLDNIRELTETIAALELKSDSKDSI